ERQTLRIDGGLVTSGGDLQLASCNAPAASATVEIEGATVHVPYDWRLGRDLFAGAPMLELHSGQHARALDTSFAVISGPGELRCKESGDVYLQRWDARRAIIDRWEQRGATGASLSQWRGSTSVGWACLALPPRRVTLALASVTPGNLDLELP